MRLSLRVILIAALAITPVLAKDNGPAERLTAAAALFSEIMTAPDKSIPVDLLAKAYCIVLVPALKPPVLIVGTKYGKGYISCRSKTGKEWSAPGTVRIEGGRAGFQVGASANDLVLLVMKQQGVSKVLSSRFTLGVEGSVAAGPVGHKTVALTDRQTYAEILCWSRSKGLFAGVALEGATLRDDLDDNQTLYGKTLGNREIVTKWVHAPESADELLSLLNRL